MAFDFKGSLYTSEKMEAMEKKGKIGGYGVKGLLYVDNEMCAYWYNGVCLSE